MGQVASWLCLLWQKWVLCIDQGQVSVGDDGGGGGGAGGHCKSSAGSCTWVIYGGVTRKGSLLRSMCTSRVGGCTTDGTRGQFRRSERWFHLWGRFKVWSYFCMKVLKSDYRCLYQLTFFWDKRQWIVRWGYICFHVGLVPKRLTFVEAAFV